jgi:ectoine hydroxylase-related dioxygenase (phytanoyl-CoA dioxygenase family)
MTATVETFPATEAERHNRLRDSDTLEQAARAMTAAGTLVLRDVFDPALIDRLREHFVATYHKDYADPARRRMEKVGDRRNLGVVEVEGVMNDPDVYANPLCHSVAKKLLGDSCIVGQFGSVTSLPGAADQNPHRDSPWLFSQPEFDVAVPVYAITTVIPLVDAHVDGPGTTRVWPGTHRVTSDEQAAEMPSVDLVLQRGSCLLMVCLLRHGGTANRSAAPRPILYISYQRTWFRDYDGYRLKPPLHIGDGEFSKVPRELRYLFAWARADNTPETVKLAVTRAIKRALPARAKAVLRRYI